VFTAGARAAIMYHEVARVDTKEFIEIRHRLAKTQNQLAMILCVSPRAVQSFEQGWRHITRRIEREMLLLLSLKVDMSDGVAPCWVVLDCPSEWRERCVAWELNASHLCWYINGTYCGGEYHADWVTKMQVCRHCDVFQRAIAG